MTMTIGEIAKGVKLAANFIGNRPHGRGATCWQHQMLRPAIAKNLRCQQGAKVPSTSGQKNALAMTRRIKQRLHEQPAGVQRPASQEAI